MKIWALFGMLCVVGLLIGGIVSMTGTGGFKRMVTLSGVYSICRPDGFDVVCFLDADGKDGGMACVPLQLAGGKCTK